MRTKLKKIHPEFLIRLTKRKREKGERKAYKAWKSGLKKDNAYLFV